MDESGVIITYPRDDEVVIDYDTFTRIWQLFRFGTKTSDMEMYLGCKIRSNDNFHGFTITMAAHERFKQLQGPHASTLIKAWYIKQRANASTRKGSE